MKRNPINLDDAAHASRGMVVDDPAVGDLLRRRRFEQPSFRRILVAMVVILSFLGLIYFAYFSGLLDTYLLPQATPR